MTMHIVESQPQGTGPKVKEPQRHYLITVEQGSPADHQLAKLNNALLSGNVRGLVDYNQVAAPTLIMALVKFCEVFGVVSSVYLNLYALLQHKKSA